MGIRELLDKQKKEKEALNAAQNSQTPIVAPTVAEPKPAVPVQEKKGFFGKKPPSPTQVVVQETKPNQPAPAQVAPEIAAPKAVPPVERDILNVNAPRDLSEKGIEELRRNLDFLANNIEQKELVGQVVRTIAVQLAENPQFSSHMVNADFNLIVRGLRKSFNTMARKRVEGKEKRETKKGLDTEYMQFVADSGIKFG